MEMNSQQKILELKQIIGEKLTPLITGNYILLDLPYYTNVGDTLIWQGALDFLKTLPYKCLYSSSAENYRTTEIDNNVIILLTGGGNFGDLWRRHQIFRRKIIAAFPNNTIILLPQSVFYKDFSLLKEDAEIFSQHKNLTMCFRDINSLDTACKYFQNSRNILLPDMAFCIDMSKWKKYIRQTEPQKILYLDRKDCEKNDSQHYDIIPPEAENHDWTAMEKMPHGFVLFKKLQFLLQKIDKISGLQLNDTVSDAVYQKIMRKYFICSGISFLSAYSTVYTTRLHGAILSVLLDKPVNIFDNSYGKNSSFYNTWLSDVENIKIIHK
ncbi:MAG: polysaccharide pyruvyl transferase family protein [Prevotellaceae bacterium]|jgi:pyruvyl transferase EpsO|nr:polysaccharide pyruvyl transferase family protein [Prevotellaceae bacterium]